MYAVSKPANLEDPNFIQGHSGKGQASSCWMGMVYRAGAGAGRCRWTLLTILSRRTPQLPLFSAFGFSPLLSSFIIIFYLFTAETSHRQSYLNV